MKKIICLLAFAGFISVLNGQTVDQLKQAKVTQIKNKTSTITHSVQNYLPQLDCVGAMPLCVGLYNSTIQFIGIGYNGDEINDQNSCLGSGELNGAWYKIYITQSGMLAFNIIPNDSLDDYDWAIFNLTNASCNDIFTDVSLEIRCNFSGVTSITGANVSLDSNATGSSENIIPVLEGETYYLYISYFGDDAFSQDTLGQYQSGYKIDLSISTCSIDSCLQQVITSTIETKNNIDLELFPNPVYQNLTLRLNSLKAGQGFSLQLFTTTGSLVKEFSNIKTTEKVVDVTNLAQGLYYYRVLTTDGKTAAGRFVKE